MPVPFFTPEDNVNRTIVIDEEYVEGEHDTLTLRFRGAEADYVRVDSLDDDLKADVLRTLRRRRNLALEGIPEALVLPPTGMDWVLGGSGPVIISLSGGVLQVVPTGPDAGSTINIPVVLAARGTAGIQFITEQDERLIFSFSSRPTPPHPAWDAAFPQRDV